MNLETLRQALEYLPVPAIYYYDQAGSTNEIALGLAEAGAPDGTLVVADEQTAGRGRLERHWITRPGSGLAFTLVLRPQGSPAEWAMVSPLCGLSVALTLEEMGLQPELKWPNDVLVNRRKVCGVLVETSWQDARLAGMAAGIGVNVAPGSVPEQNEVLFPAGCVEEALDHPVERTALLAGILKQFFAWRPRLGSEPFITAWESRLAFRNEWVKILQPAGELEGRVLGITSNGSLRLHLLDGAVAIIDVGDVRLRPVC